ncbi:MAG: YihY/virulence factor BrkB family protein [Acidobacteria bacterium]|nr:YihY/virulence factor BrkB family protein [Acidobacteriaceae bacterium]MBV9610724.1 YihY/virulence factor BrkB family protein [Acidobacteriota bacterium]
MFKFARLLRRAFWRAFQNDAFATAKGVAYSAILSFFPSILVVASVLAASKRTQGLLREFSYALARIMPSGTGGPVRSLVEGKHNHPIGILTLTAILTLWTSSGIMISLMEGFRRAYNLPKTWNLVEERLRSFLLVFLTFVPMSFATLLLAFGNQIESWLLFRANHEIGFYILLMWTLTRWVIATATSILVILLIYHWGVPRTHPWHLVIPGAALASGMWFPATVLFGWYLRRFSTYSILYGSLGTAMALLVWMYIISIIILIGAEFNALIHPKSLTGNAPAALQDQREYQVR